MLGEAGRVGEEKAGLRRGGVPDGGGGAVRAVHAPGTLRPEAETVARMDSFLAEKGYVNDLSETRMHHEIYLSDARRVIPEKWKTVIRHPIRRG